VDIMTEGDFDPDIGEDSILDLDTEPLRYEDYLRRYLDGDTDFSALKKEPEIIQKAAPKSKEQLISELAPKISKPGITFGKATIEARRMYTEVENRYGSNADTVLEMFQPGQDPSKFLDGFRNAYIAGKLGNKAALENSTAAAYLTEDQRAAAFELGAWAAGRTADYGDMPSLKGTLQYFREVLRDRKQGGGLASHPLDVFPENDIMDKTRNRQKRHFWNIMSRQPGIPQDYLRMLTERFDQGTNLGKKVFLKYVTSDSVADFAEKGRNRFGKNDKRIRIDAQRDMSDPRGAGTRFFHEHGHLIDYVAAGRRRGERLSTRNGTFYQLIQSDFETMCNRLIQREAVAPKDVYKVLSRKLRGKDMHAVSDIVGGLTGNECVGKYKHEPEYWENPGSLERETFAHMLEALFDRRKYAQLEEYFPNALSEFIRLLEEIV